MVVTELAEVSLAYYAGELLAMAGIPVVGLILLIVGLRQRSHDRQMPPGYPPPGPYPYGPPPNTPADSGYPYPPGPPAPPMSPQYYPSPYPSPRPPRSGIALIVVGSLMLTFGLLGILGRAADLVPQHQNTPRSVKVGQCIAQSSFNSSNLSPVPQDCGRPDSLLEVATAEAGSATCPDGKLKDSKYAVLFDKSTTLCFLLNLQQGQCYSATGPADSPVFAEADCDESTRLIQVVRRIDGNSDLTMCPAEAKAVSYPQPARLYCLQPLRK